MAVIPTQPPRLSTLGAVIAGVDKRGHEAEHSRPKEAEASRRCRTYIF